jgi:hypothetical protein
MPAIASMFSGMARSYKTRCVGAHSIFHIGEISTLTRSIKEQGMIFIIPIMGLIIPI